MNILHLTRDEKFVPFVHAVFRGLPGVVNRWLIRPIETLSTRKHVAAEDAWRWVRTRYFFSADMQRDLAWADCLIVHSLGPRAARMILNSRPQTAVVWSGWGADYYGFLPGGVDALLQPDTKKLLKSLKRGHHRLLEVVRLYAKEFADNLYVRRAIERIDLVSTPIPDDFDLLKSALAHTLKATYVQLNYGSVEETFAPGSSLISAKHILVGNSASPTNNHIEVLQALARRRLGRRQIIVPLSYGQSDYRDAVVKCGVEMLGGSFSPLLDFLPLPQYNALLASCSAVIMNHRRQQGVGNIGTMMYNGARIYLDDQNVVFRFLRARGAHVFSTQELLLDGNESAFDPLSEAEKHLNRQILRTIWGHDVVLMNAMELLRKVSAINKARSH